MKTTSYNIAENILQISVDSEVTPWEALEWHYTPFETEPTDAPTCKVTLTAGTTPVDGLKVVFRQPSVEEGEIELNVYADAERNYIFELRQPSAATPNAWVKINSSFSDAHIVLDCKNPAYTDWENQCSITSAMMLSFLFATASHNTLVSHSACIVNDGSAYIFIGKSGTGKSTHARLWLKHIAGSVLLNDDHPILRIYPEEKRVVAFGSPWSGKTHCYKRLEAPLRAVVRIRQAPYNKIKRIAGIEAYASVSTSFSGMTWDKIQANERHTSLEQLVSFVPCYILECLPDQQAAEVCHAAISL